MTIYEPDKTPIWAILLGPPMAAASLLAGSWALGTLCGGLSAAGVVILLRDWRDPRGRTQRLLTESRNPSAVRRRLAMGEIAREHAMPHNRTGEENLRILADRVREAAADERDPLAGHARTLVSRMPVWLRT